MKESEAWRILAEEFDARRVTSSYLCDCLEFQDHGLAAYDAIPDATREKMVSRIKGELDGRHAAYDVDPVFYTQPSWARPARVLACLMFSEQCKDEERRK